MGPYRTTSITTKLLHLKRPNLIPICDSYVCSMVGKRAGNATGTTSLIMAVREIGCANLDALAEISQRLRSIGINRTLSAFWIPSSGLRSRQGARKPSSGGGWFDGTGFRLFF
jgi:Family of unknown function (DUF6308)